MTPDGSPNGSGPRGLAPLLLALLLAACGGTAGPSAPVPTPSATTAGAADAADAVDATEAVDAAVAADAAATITAADMSARIHTLAHDTLRGRGTPSPGLDRAADYLATQFRELGLEPAGEAGTYLHRYDFEKHGFESAFLRVKGSPDPAPRYGDDYFLIASQQAAPVEGPAVYAGRAGEVASLPADARGGVIFFDVRGTDLDAQFQQQLGAAIQPAMMAGAAALVVVLDPAFPRTMVAQIAQGVAGQRAPIPVVGVTHEQGTALLTAAGADVEAVRAAGRPTVLDAAVEIGATPVTETHRPPNVVAMVRGSDPEFRDTYVVVTAHFDHLGVGTPNEAGDSIYNGADDNASGTAALLEMAGAFAALPEPPRRSVVFLAVSGEEHGLLGSTAFVENPTVPVENVVANVNLDMVGRNAPDTIIGIGQEYSTLEDVLAAIRADHPELGLNVIRDQQPEEMYFFRSDQLAFIKKMIPAVFFTGSDHEDYHQPSDEPEKIDGDKAARVARLAFHLAYRIAMDPEAPQWTPEGKRQIEELLSTSPF